jgi:hypothetical protein
MAWTLREQNGILRIEFTGTLTNQDLVAGEGELERIERSAPVVPSRLSDLGLAERLEIDFHGVLALALARRQMIFKNSFKSAIVAPDFVRFGFARMFQTLNDHPQITIAIFPDVAGALDWLAGSTGVTS